jgi:hypothetical protein
VASLWRRRAVSLLAPILALALQDEPQPPTPPWKQLVDHEGLRKSGVMLERARQH